MSGRFDSIILIGFGGPTKGCCRRYAECPGEAYCYVEGIVGERAGGSERIREVAAHYRHFGGVSPFTYFSQKQAGALEMALEEAGVRIPVYTGYRFWTPYVRETLAEMGRRGLRRALGVILAPHRTKISWEAYRGAVASAREELGGAAPETAFLETPWHRRPGFIDAVAGRVRQAAAEGEGGERGAMGGARVIFTAHSIPVSMARTSAYAEEFRETATLAARRLGLEEHRVGFQSSPDAPPGTWLGPDVKDVIREAAAEGADAVLLVPVGFLCDHVEVLFDLDIEAREAAEEAGLAFCRAPTVGTHPAFIGMLRDLVLDATAGERG